MLVYVAQKELKFVDKNDKVTFYQRGDVIPDFESWDIHAVRAHLNMENVLKVEGDATTSSSAFEPIAAKPIKAAKAKKLASKKNNSSEPAISPNKKNHAANHN